MYQIDLSFLKDIVRRFFYPELLVVTCILGYLATLSLPITHFSILLVLILTSFVTIALSFIHRRSFFLDATSVTLTIICIGLLHFSYLPTISLWLFLCYRLLVASREHLISLVLLAVTLIGFNILIFLAILPKITLSFDEQATFNYVILSVSMVIFGCLFWQLTSRLQEQNARLKEKQNRISALITVTNALTKFIPPQIWQPIVRTNKPMKVANQRKKLTIFFSDIKGFTELSDTLSPDHLADILNTYFDRMTQIANKYGATLDKFIGDGMLCYFGDNGNLSDKENALLCANMAIDMRREMKLLRQQWRLLGFPGLHIRIGINTGYCHVGNFGSGNRMAYTIIGREANIASRLESTAEQDQILISASTFNLICHEHNCELAGKYLLKGLKEPVLVWQLIDPNYEKNESDWMSYDLPGFNLHLNFKDVRNYDEQRIRNHLNHALEQLEKKTKHHSDA